MFFEHPLITADNRRAAIHHATPLTAHAPSHAVEEFDARWLANWGNAIPLGWSMRDVPNVSRYRRHLRKDNGRGWRNLSQYQEASNRLAVAVKRFITLNRAAQLIAIDWRRDYSSGWVRLAFPEATFLRRFAQDGARGALWISPVPPVESFHAAVDLILLDAADFLLVSSDFTRALSPYDGGIDYFRSAL
ncbi:hypothetical protein [Curtobacterium sp. HSID17257]|uniref:hypothetical protein n=1 Tax=Curtobacterium sp. HSID17257 TaxID=2419510 RepID=UPI0011D11923|nr:hypothetical protein [Curtobacterium sp. HSID17257]